MLAKLEGSNLQLHSESYSDMKHTHIYIRGTIKTALDGCGAV